MTSILGVWRAGKPVADLLSQLRLLLHAIPFAYRVVDGDFWIARGRVLRAVPICTNHSEIFIPSFGCSENRANTRGEKVFYGANSIDAVEAEIGYEQGESVMLASYRLREGQTLRLMQVGMTDFGVKAAESFDNLRSALEEYRACGLDDRGAANILLIDRLLGEFFVADVVEQSNYSLAVAIAKFFLSDSEADGIVYPSVKSPGSMNYALTEASAISKIKPIKFTHTVGVGHGWGCVMHAKEMDAQGRILWAKPEFHLAVEYETWKANFEPVPDHCVFDFHAV